MCGEIDLEDHNWDIAQEIFIGKLIKEERKEVVIFTSENDTSIVAAIESHFEVLTKWKGSSDRIVRILQIGNSCSYDYRIDNFHYLITAYKKNFKHQIEGKTGFEFLTNDLCTLILHQATDKDDFDKAKSMLNEQFSEFIELTKTLETNTRNTNINYLHISLSLIIGGVLGTLIYKTMTNN